MLFLCNSFSVNMLRRGGNATWVAFKPVSEQEAAHIWREARASREAKSAVGHADTAALFQNILGAQVEACRSNVELLPSDMLLVGQYTGPRLPEGATTLPEGATINWWLIST